MKEGTNDTKEKEIVKENESTQTDTIPIQSENDDVKLSSRNSDDNPLPTPTLTLDRSSQSLIEEQGSHAVSESELTAQLETNEIKSLQTKSILKLKKSVSFNLQRNTLKVYYKNEQM